MQDFLELKKLVINELAGQFDEHEKAELGKKFKLSAERMDDLIKELLNKWLSSADLVVMIASLLGLSAPRKMKERKTHYIG
ncbi:MAG: hypothetical protein HY517_03825 [Candidatus Aenigmarchaeota archaeon]|nr:hypothetical protein [Candidatus Aenigmarchaeota archaeon]